MKKILLTLVLAGFSVSNALATGLSKSVNVGPKAIALGGAFVGIADDPTAIFHNPAGITQLTGHQFQIGTDSLITDLEYTPPSSAAENVKTEFLPVPNFGYVTDYFKLVSVGLGVYFPHGNGGKFSNPSAAPGNPNEGRIYSMEIAPAIGWKIVKELSVGATLRVVRVSSSLKGQLVPTSPTTFLSVDDLSVSGWSVGASAGALYTPCEYFSFGANYRSKVKATLKGNTDVTDLSTSTALTNLSTEFDQILPTFVSAGFGIHPVKKATIGLGYSFERNSEIKSFDATLETLGNISLPQNWKDSHTIHFGAEYKVLPELAVRGGYAKDLNRSIPDAVMNRVVGDIASHELSAGMAYTWKRYTLSGTWNGRFGERTIANNGTNPGPGKYEAFVHSLSMALGVAL